MHDLQRVVSEFAAGPLWHVQNILASTPEGFLCQDDYQSAFLNKTPPQKMASPVRPLWVGIAGPAGSTLGSEEWHFVCRHGRNDIPQKNHLFLRTEGKTVRGASFSTLSVFVPMSPGTTAITTPPAQATVQESGGRVTIGQRTYSFGKANANSVAVALSGKDETGHECSVTVSKRP
jgi:hypothetical protein